MNKWDPLTLWKILTWRDNHYFLQVSTGNSLPAARLAPPHSDHCCAPLRFQKVGTPFWIAELSHAQCFAVWTGLCFIAVWFCLMLPFQLDCKPQDQGASFLLFPYLRMNGSLMHAVWYSKIFRKLNLQLYAIGPRPQCIDHPSSVLLKLRCAFQRELVHT